MELFEVWKQVREKAPLVQCITNFVTVNDCANILLASGASPTMAQDIREVEEAVEQSAALVCNLGAIDFVDSMCLAGKRANALGIPVVLDPVAAGGTALRQTLSARLLSEVRFSTIRGNASEIRALADCGGRGSGVDAHAADEVTEENLEQSVALVRRLAQELHTVVALSGKLDIVSDGVQTAVLRNGCATMSRITGSGCMLTALIGGFCAAVPEEPFSAVCAAMAVMGVCGELAELRRLQNGTGNATFRTDLIDAVFTLTESQFKEMLCYEQYSR